MLTPELPRITTTPTGVPVPPSEPTDRSTLGGNDAAILPTRPLETEYSSLPRFEGYLTLELMATGGYGSVYKVFRRGEGNFAAKVLREDLFVADPDKDKLIDYEANIMEWVRHGNVMPIEDRGKLPDNRTYFVMPLCSEGAFADACYPRFSEEGIISGFDRGRDVQSVFLRRLIHATDGLANLHAHQIIHRDISPGNILRYLGRGVVSDLGNAIFVDHQYAARPQSAEPLTWMTPFDRNHRGNPNTVIGNMKFMSPEQMRALWLEPRSDVFSVATIAHVFAYGVHPFDERMIEWDVRRDSQDFRLMQATGRGKRVAITRPPGAQSIPHSLCRMIDGGLAINPLDRPTAREVATALRQTCDSLGIAEHANLFESEAIERRILCE